MNGTNSNSWLKPSNGGEPMVTLSDPSDMCTVAPLLISELTKNKKSPSRNAGPVLPVIRNNSVASYEAVALAVELGCVNGPSTSTVT